jgi:non-specific serine/threonine protein kinase
VKAAGAALPGPSELGWLDRLEEEHDNLRVALAWALAQRDGVSALRLAGTLARFWEVRGHLSEGRAWLGRALETEAPAPAEVRAPALFGAATLAYLQGDFETARARRSESGPQSRGRP